MATISLYKSLGSEEPFTRLASSLGIEYRRLRLFLSTILYFTDP